MSIRCSEGFNGGLQQQFMLEVREMQTNELRANYSSPVPRFTVNSLMPSTTYLASVFAFNTKGRSDPTVVQVSMLRMPDKQPTGEKGKQKLFGVSRVYAGNYFDSCYKDLPSSHLNNFHFFFSFNLI